MKRNHKDIETYEHGVFKHFSVFTYHQCVKCKKDFRFEKGWTFLSGPFFNNRGNRKYICSSCAKSEEAANKVAIEYTNKKPNTPPPASDNNTSSSRMTVYELIDLIEGSELKLEDHLLSVQLFGDESGCVKVQGNEYDFDNFEKCIEILNKYPHEL